MADTTPGPDPRETLDRLGEIKDEIKELVEEARATVALAFPDHSNRARRTWIARIRMALDEDHEWVGRQHTLEDTLYEIECDLDDRERLARTT